MEPQLRLDYKLFYNTRQDIRTRLLALNKLEQETSLKLQNRNQRGCKALPLPPPGEAKRQAPPPGQDELKRPSSFMLL